MFVLIGFLKAIFLRASRAAALVLFGLLLDSANATPSSIIVPAATFVNGQNVAVGAATCGGGLYGAMVLLNDARCLYQNQVAEFIFRAPLKIAAKQIERGLG